MDHHVQDSEHIDATMMNEKPKSCDHGRYANKITDELNQDDREAKV